MTATIVKMRTSDDAFLGGALRILQPQDGYRAGVDAVLLAAAAPVREGCRERVLDVGAGVGTVGLAVARRVPDAAVTMVERDPGLAALARANVERNGLSGRARVEEGDVCRPLREIEGLAAEAESFDHVLANPPFQAEGRGTPASDQQKAASHAMPGGDLDRWVRFMAAMARPGGTASLIHRADALADILEALSGRFGGTVVLPVHPRQGAPASRIVMQGTKGSRAPMRLLPGLMLHDAAEGFRPEIEAILRHGAALSLGETIRTT